MALLALDCLLFATKKLSSLKVFFSVKIPIEFSVLDFSVSASLKLFSKEPFSLKATRWCYGPEAPAGGWRGVPGIG